MAIDNYEICCHLTPLDIVQPEDDSVPCRMFSIEVSASFLPPIEESDIEEDESELFDSECDIIHHRFLIESEKLSVETVREILEDMNVPVQSVLVDRILGFVRQIGSNKRYIDRKIVRMRVEIDVPQSMDDDDDDSGLVPATEASIEALEEIRVEDSTRSCAICLEEVLMGSEATRMPNCRHVYHTHCILNWLEKGRSCPMCRTEIY